MMPTIRIDDEVWAWLKRHARPLEDSPNSVLRRIAGLQDPHSSTDAEMSIPSAEHQPQVVSQSKKGGRMRYSGRVYSGLTGRQLNAEWKVGASHPLFHKEGTYYNHLLYFPGALFDLNGYVRFASEEAYRKSPFLQHGQQLHVPGGISKMPGYVRMREPN
jgi:hypothetical protein